MQRRQFLEVQISLNDVQKEFAPEQRYLIALVHSDSESRNLQGLMDMKV